MNASLFQQILLHLYGTRRRVALVLFFFAEAIQTFGVLRCKFRRIFFSLHHLDRLHFPSRRLFNGQSVRFA